MFITLVVSVVTTVVLDLLLVDLRQKYAVTVVTFFPTHLRVGWETNTRGHTE